MRGDHQLERAALLLPKEAEGRPRPSAPADWKALFDARAATLASSDGARRFFLQFDAWTNSELVERLDDAGFVASLRAPSRRLFAIPRPSSPFRSSKAFLEMAVMLSKQLVARAQRLMLRMPLTPPFPDPSDERPPLPCTTHEAAILKMAGFLERVFEHGFPGLRKSRGRGAPWEQFVDAFSAFGAGALATQPSASPGGPPTLLNTEPDGAYFFLFAEFALSRVELRWSPFWFRVARLFVALQDLFDAAYEWPLLRRDLLQYARKPGGAAGWKRVFAAHLGRFEREFDGRRRLQRLTRAHAMNVAHANRDLLVAVVPDL